MSIMTVKNYRTASAIELYSTMFPSDFSRASISDS